jgi:hypothetical protein
MLRRRGPRNVLVGGVACVTAAALAAVAMAIGRGHGSASAPAKYRYAGVVENGRSAPAHYIATGEAFNFVFFDYEAQGLRRERYRLCLGRPARPPAKCWSRTARFGVGRLRLSFVLPRNLPLGLLTARWLVGGRRVAVWPFFYARGE